MIIEPLQQQVLINKDKNNFQGLTVRQKNNYQGTNQFVQRRKYSKPKQFSTQFPQIKKDDTQYEFKMFHHVQNMKSAHYQSKYTLSMGIIPNLILHTYFDQIVFYDMAKLKSQSARISLEAIGLDVFENICAVAGMNGDLLMINLYNGTLYKQNINLKRHFINHVHFYHDYLITNDNGGYIKIFDYQNGLKEIFSYEDKASVNLTAVNQNKQIAYCGDRIGLNVLDALSGKMIHTMDPHTEFGFAVAFNPSKGYELASSSEDGSAVIYDLRSPKLPIQQFIGSNFPIYNVTYQRNGSHLFIAESSSHLHVLDTTLYDKIQTISVFGEVSGIVNDFYDDNRFYFSTSCQYGDGICEFVK
ncbi:unnamed protein product (macronuclear) [Paramecium tetraurelia]|uniref:Uncharacterized protein n=1 Tax=Paramecium tetraurelia TaxID=5888 RepID=A0C6J2_PARTE|nr:uncharacterized protein GSPATT00035538001 [Paramecium tetraurelia]CAK66409.1 unnamed protein product [Paramecium tetraurelia]|eukprot:XP_001433806.1 hypothetical protein (macronuclear) [Paramecium tetraurelia strain d4-2]